jgi:hypothetical protein
MKLGKTLTKSATTIAVLGLMIAPLTALAQEHHRDAGRTVTRHSQTTRTTHRHVTVQRDIHIRRNNLTIHNDWRGRNIYSHHYNPGVVIVHDHNWYRSHPGFVHRYNEQNEWRNLAIGAGFLGVIGLLEDDDTLFFAGSAGALYSVYRYDQDRYSSDRRLRARAYYFGRPDFWRDGVHFTRRSVWRDGREYYQFYRD